MEKEIDCVLRDIKLALSRLEEEELRFRKEILDAVTEAHLETTRGEKPQEKEENNG